MRKPDSFCPVEHKDVWVGREEAVIERIAEAQRRKTFEKRRPCVRSEFKLGFVIHMQDYALVVVCLCAKLDPTFVIAEINRLVFRSIDVSRPEQADVAVREHMLVRFAAEHHVDVTGSNELESSPAFQMESGRGRLMKLSFAPGDFREGHRGIARLKEHFSVPLEFVVAI